MSLLSKGKLYLRTVSHLKPSQVVYRLWRRLGGTTPLRRGHRVKGDPSCADIGRIPLLQELDFDTVFLKRFSPDDIVRGRIELLNCGVSIDWGKPWLCEEMSALWKFNLHYCEFVLPLAKAACGAGSDKYVEGGKDIISSWISVHPRSAGGAPWDPYVISMRVANWLAFYGEARDAIDGDEPFLRKFNDSLYEQYCHLSVHLEKDILANHYLENLKAMILLAAYFDDAETLHLTVSRFVEQIGEQILSDGMHFELSPMYQKIMLECLMRVAGVVRACDSEAYAKLHCSLKSMVDCLYSLERGIERTPLFNDSGDNVSKSAVSLLRCAERHFGVEPSFTAELSESGYCIFERSMGNAQVKAIIDVGAPGPAYALGHAHCDMLSFELFYNGRPWVVNCGTFAYQDPSRLRYKNTDAHNAPRFEDCEQSECWASFRMARMASMTGWSRTENELEATMVDHRGRPITRRIEFFPEGVLVRDSTSEKNIPLVSTVHVAEPFAFAEGVDSAESRYAPEFGGARTCHQHQVRGAGLVEYFLPVPEECFG